MVLKTAGCHVRENRLWCGRVTVVMLESNGCGVMEQRLWC
jgi:hypothetical protein